MGILATAADERVRTVRFDDASIIVDLMKTSRPMACCAVRHPHVADIHTSFSCLLVESI